MNKKKQPKVETKSKKKNVKSKTNEQKKPIKGIIIAAAAIILVAAIILTAIFVVKPAVEKKNETTTASSDSQSTSSNSGRYTYVEYKGASLPQEFVDVLNRAESDRIEACQEYGKALEVGDIDISKPEFMSYYYDAYVEKVNEVSDSIQQNGENTIGFATDVLPDEQDCPGKGYTWAEELTRNAITAIREEYEAFDRALEKKITLTDNDVDMVISEYEMLETFSKEENKTYEEMFSAIYGEGYTEWMYKSRLIMVYCRQKYQQEIKQELYDGYSEETLSKKLDEDVNAYTIVKSRIYVIEGKYDAAEVSKISNEKEFLEYAKNNHPSENYDADSLTLCNYLTRQRISDAYGEGVAQWLFSDERKAGEIAVVDGRDSKCLVYIEKTPYLGVSRKIMFCAYDYSGISSKEIEEIRTNVQTEYNNWKANGEKEADFKALCDENGGYSEYDVVSGVFFYIFEDWIFDSDRKHGDHTFIDSDIGCVMMYFLEENEDDYEWKQKMRTELSEKEAAEMSQEDIDKNYEAKRDDKVINKTQKDTNVVITRKIAERKKEAKTEAE